MSIAVAGSGLFLLPLERFNRGGNTTPNAVDHEAGGDASYGPLSAYAIIYERDLQRPLYDPKPAPKPVAPPPQPPVTLVGTVIEEGFAVAMLKTKSGQVKMVSEGETVEETEVLEITSNEVRLRYAGHEHVLTLKKGTEGL